MLDAPCRKTRSTVRTVDLKEVERLVVPPTAAQTSGGPAAQVALDYLLEEMQWMATDFAQERRWKVAAAKKVDLGDRHTVPRQALGAADGNVLYMARSPSPSS